MIEIHGDLWTVGKGHVIGITTNGTVKNNGACVMGRGVALQAMRMYPRLPFQLGDRIKTRGNCVFQFDEYNLVTIPVKHQWHETADPELIRNSLEDLADVFKYLRPNDKVFMPRPGCGNGGLDWKDIKPMCEEILDDRFTIVEIKP